MALTRHPAGPDRPFTHWRHKVAAQIAALEGTRADVLKEQQLIALRRKLETGVVGQWNKRRRD